MFAESLGKQGRGPTPLTVVLTRDLHSRGQQNQDGARDKFINNLVVRAARAQPIGPDTSQRVATGCAVHRCGGIGQRPAQRGPSVSSSA